MFVKFSLISNPKQGVKTIYVRTGNQALLLHDLFNDKVDFLIHRIERS